MKNNKKIYNKRLISKLVFFLVVASIFILSACSNNNTTNTTTNASSESVVKTQVSEDTNKFTYLKIGEIYEPGNESFGELYKHETYTKDEISHDYYSHRTDEGDVIYTVYNNYVQEIKFYPADFKYRGLSVEHYNDWYANDESEKVTEDELREMYMTTEEYVEKKFNEHRALFIPKDAKLIRTGSMVYANLPMSAEFYSSNLLPQGVNTDIYFLNIAFPKNTYKNELTDVYPTEFVVTVPVPYPEFEPNYFSVRLDTRGYND